MKRVITVGCGLALCIFVFWNCRTQTASNATTPDASVSGTIEKMKTYLANAGQKMDELAVSEAASLYVNALALKDGIARPPQDVLDLAAEAETALAKIEAGCLLQAGAEWLNAESVQIAASSVGTLLSPKVTLWYNVDGSRIAVSGAPVVFTVKQGPARMAGTGLTATNEYGEASIPPPAVSDFNREIVVSAAVVFSSGGYRYPFRQTKLDLVYRPPSKRAVILVFERDDQGQVNDDPYILDPVYDALKKMEFDFSQYNGRLLGDDFMKVYGGDPQAISKLSLEQSVPFLVLVLNDCYSVRQQRGMEMYISEGRATLRIIRAADGKVLFEAVGYVDRKHDNYGQGNSHDNAARDVYRKNTAELVKVLSTKMKEINTALGLD
ncbi:MAG: hypothetical protein JXD23_17485 [Spirochaetales bacterium]|nr:hypothetical protein [Spirochaetales bacterium]